MKRHEEEALLSSRESFEAAFRKNTELVIEAIDLLWPEDFETQIQLAEGGEVSMRHLVGLPAWHATLHLGQIDFLQTCWDDQKVYVE